MIKILFVLNIALCQGKRLNICTKLWCSSDFWSQHAIPSAFPSVISSTQYEAHTCLASHSHTRSICSTDCWMPEGGKHFIFPFGKASSLQSVRHFLSAYLFENKFILLSHDYTHKHTSTHTIYNVLLKLLKFYKNNNTNNNNKVRVLGWWNSSCLCWVSLKTWLSFQTNLFTCNLLKVFYFT